MNKKQILLITIFSLLPILAFATDGDATFSSIHSQIKGYLTGSLGNVLVILALMGAVIALAGHAPMKVMLPVLGVALSIKYGPTILESILGADGSYPAAIFMHHNSFTLVDLASLLISTGLFVIGIHHKKLKARNI